MTVLGISDHGTMWDESGAPIIKSDVTIAMRYADSALKARIQDWWQRQSRD